MRRREFIALLSVAVAGPCTLVAQPADQAVPRVGVLIQGGSIYSSVDGLREGLKDAGLQEGQRLALIVKDTKGDLSAIGTAARALESGEGVELIVAFATSVTLAAKRSTSMVPIVCS